MRIAIIGSRNISNVELAKYVPESVTEIVSGGAKGVDTLAKEYALKQKLKLTEFLPNWNCQDKCSRKIP